jgi:hypothetical protein
MLGFRTQFLGFKKRNHADSFSNTDAADIQAIMQDEYDPAASVFELDMLGPKARPEYLGSLAEAMAADEEALAPLHWQSCHFDRTVNHLKSDVSTVQQPDHHC